MSIASCIAKAGTTGTVQEPTTTRERGGGRASPTWDTVLVADAPVWVQEASAGTVQRYAAKQQKVSHRIYIETDPLCNKAGCRILVGGTYYLIRGHTDMGGLGRIWRIDTERTSG